MATQNPELYVTADEAINQLRELADTIEREHADEMVYLALDYRYATTDDVEAAWPKGEQP